VVRPKTTDNSRPDGDSDAFANPVPGPLRDAHSHTEPFSLPDAHTIPYTFPKSDCNAVGKS
jgi:hypothetical protein